MMRQSLAVLVVAACLTITTGCKDMGPNEPMIELMKDSVFKTNRGINYIRIEVSEHSDVSITIGDKTYYNGPEENRLALIETLAKLSVHYFEENNYLDDGKVIFVENETTIATEADPKKEYNMDMKPYMKKD